MNKYRYFDTWGMMYKYQVDYEAEHFVASFFNDYDFTVKRFKDSGQYSSSIITDGDDITDDYDVEGGRDWIWDERLSSRGIDASSPFSLRNI